MDEAEILEVREEHLAMRLDRAICLFFPEYTRSYFQKLIEEGHVLVNGKIPKKREQLTLGDEIAIVLAPSGEITLVPENIPLNILFEDEHLIVINKTAGLVVHPAPGHPNGTLVNALLYHCKTLLEADGSLRPGIVHRLDKDTSGIIIAAKTPMAHSKLSALFSERKIKKNYLAICSGHPGDQTIDKPLYRHPINRKEIHVSTHANAKQATTICKTLVHDQGFSLVELDLITGRTHQIRVHLKHIKAPVLGDCTYGVDSLNKKYQITRQMLHAYRLELIHPFTGEVISLKAELPDDFLKCLEILKLKTENPL